MNIGRNDPCHCGSGKKYKKCCLAETEPSPDEFKKHRWSAVQVGLIKKILNHISKVYGPEAIDEAYNEFQLFDTEDGFNPDSPELPIFMPWLFYSWYPDGEVSLLEDAPHIPPAQSLAESGNNISSDEEQYLLECCRTSFSFFEILEIVPDKSLKLKDVLTEEFHNVLEKKATQGVQIGDLFFGKVMSIDGIDVLEACAPIVIRPSFKTNIIDLRKRIHKKNKLITHDILNQWGIEVLEVYRFIYESITNPPKPVLTNTDGQLMVPHKLVFEIESADDMFEALHELCFNTTREELLEDAKIDKSGHIEFIEFPWLKKGNKKHKTWDNTIYGHIKIDGTKMIVEVNSKERSELFQKELNKRSPRGWKLKSTLIESIESQLENTKTSKSKQISMEKEQEEMLSNPEIKQHLEKMMKAHWDNWIMDSIPALGGLRPVDAAKTKDGREALDALLTQFERDADLRPMIGQTRKTFESIRSKLGL